MKNKYKLILTLILALIITLSACKNDVDMSMADVQSTDSVAPTEPTETKEDIIAKYKAEGIVFYTSHTDTNGLLLYSYNMNNKENIFINENLANVRDRDNIVIYKNKIIYALSDNNYGEILMQYNIDEAKSYELENTSNLFNFRGGFTSAKMQIYNNELFANFSGAIYKAAIDEGIKWEQIIPRLDDEGHIYQLCVTDNYVFFFTNQFMLSSDIHYFHIFRMKHDGSEITNIYDSEEHNTDGGSTGAYARMYIVEDKIFLFNDRKTVLDFNGNVLIWDMSTN